MWNTAQRKISHRQHSVVLGEMYLLNRGWRKQHQDRVFHTVSSHKQVYVDSQHCLNAI